jgi:hypothetical protein
VKKYHLLFLTMPFNFRVKKLCFLALLFISFNCLAQNKFELGDRVSFTKNNVVFSFKKPIPFLESNDSYGGPKEKLVRSFWNEENITVIQVYSTVIPAKLQLDAANFFSDELAIKNFVNGRFPAPVNKLVSYQLITIESRPFIEITTIINDIQKSKSLITFFKNTMVNFVGSSTLSNFKNIEGFLNELNRSIILR